MDDFGVNDNGESTETLLAHAAVIDIAKTAVVARNALVNGGVSEAQADVVAGNITTFLVQAAVQLGTRGY